MELNVTKPGEEPINARGLILADFSVAKDDVGYFRRRGDNSKAYLTPEEVSAHEASLKKPETATVYNITIEITQPNGLPVKIHFDAK